MRHIGKAVFVLLLSATGALAMDDRGTKEDQEACTPDVFNLCSALIPDEPAILACLQGRKADLSPACSKVLFPEGTNPGSKRKRVKGA